MHSTPFICSLKYYFHLSIFTFSSVRNASIVVLEHRNDCRIRWAPNSARMLFENSKAARKCLFNKYFFLCFFISGGLRDYEVYRFNNTVISSGETKVFKYFWKIERFTERLQSNLSVLSSPVFVISGLNLRIKATLNHGEKDNMYLQVEQLSPLDDELRKRPNVILQEGSLYDSVETKKFLRHKIVLLNQVMATVRINDLRKSGWDWLLVFIVGLLQGVPFSDLNSQEFWNTNTGFTIPYRALLTNSYLKQDKILVEVVIYLWGSYLWLAFKSTSFASVIFIYKCLNTD